MAIFGNSIIIESQFDIDNKYKWLYELNEYTILEANNSDRIDRSVKEYISDASNYILEAQKSKNKNKELAKGYALASAGLLLFSLVLGFTQAVTVMLLAVLLAVILLVSSIFAGLYFAGSAAVSTAAYIKDVAKLKSLKKELTDVRNRTSDPKQIAQLNEMIYSIENSI